MRKFSLPVAMAVRTPMWLPMRMACISPFTSLRWLGNSGQSGVLPVLENSK
jgi:hypothetical protein